MSFFSNSGFMRKNPVEIILVIVTLLGAILIGYYFASLDLTTLLLGDRLSSVSLDKNNSEVVFLLARRLLILIAGCVTLILIGRATIKLNVELLVGILICSLPLILNIGPKLPGSYQDKGGYVTSANLTSVFLLFVFGVLVIKDSAWIGYTLQHPIIRTLFLIFLLGFFTQVYHLGLKNGFLIAFVRVFQPILFVILTSYLSRSDKGIRAIQVFIIASVIIAVLYGVVSENAGRLDQSAYIRRPGIIGSWTIYATILVSILPMVVYFEGTLKSLSAKLFLLVLMLVVVREIFLTETRSAILAMAALLIFVLEKRFRTLFLIVLVSAVVFLSFTNVSPVEFSSGRVLTLDIPKMFQDVNWLIRMSRNSEAFTYMVNHPFVGLALGQPTMETGPELAFWTYNPYLAWGSAFGILAFLAFMYLMAKSFFDAVQNYFREKDENKLTQLSLFTVLVVWVINQLTTGDSLTYLQPIEATFYFYAVIGMVMGQKYMSDREHILSKAL